MYDLWKKLFGILWCDYTSIVHNVGSFVLDKSKHTCYTDNNTVNMLGLRNNCDYDMLFCALKDVESDYYNDGINISIAYSEGDVQAGFVTISNVIPVAYNDLPLCSRLEIVSQLVKGEPDSYLTMIQFEDRGHMHVSVEDVALALTGILAFADGMLISAVDDTRFWLYERFNGDYDNRLLSLQKHVDKYIYANNGNVFHKLTFSAGYSPCESNVNACMKNVEFALYESMSNEIGSINMYSEEMFITQIDKYERIRRFDRLVDNNLFTYHYQPIVDVRTSDIVAYEALMRTDASIDMNPLQVLEIAKSMNKLYDIEKATLKNTLKAVSENQHVFDNRKLFVNSIPSHFLTYADWVDLTKEYDSLMKKIVIEMTEESELDDASLISIKDRLKNNNIELAIDDYGTGYSNTINLLRYGPNYVKIDRSLITNIDTNMKVQKLLYGIIEFIHQNGYFALAEGVETKSELNTVISLGADLVQGYYIAKPQPIFLQNIERSIADEMLKMSQVAGLSVGRVYQPADNEVLDLADLSVSKYNVIAIDVANVTIKGSLSATYNMSILIKDNVSTTVVFEDVNITCDNGLPIIDIGTNAKLELVVTGENSITHYGIHVPSTASFTLSGDGDLSIRAYVANAYCIGTNVCESHGSICLRHSGRLYLKAGGETSVAVGGGENADSNLIKIYGGIISIDCSGGSSLGIGSLHGNSLIDIKTCAIKFNMASNNFVCIGAIVGRVSISIVDYTFDFVLAGIDVCGIGVLNSGSGSISLKNGFINGKANGRAITCIGCHNGSSDCNIDSSHMIFYCEGNYVRFAGNDENIGIICISNSTIDLNACCKDGACACTKGELVDHSVRYEIKINE